MTVLVLLCNYQLVALCALSTVNVVMAPLCLWPM